MKRIFQVLLISCFSFSVATAQTYRGKFLEANYDESKVPDYTLPDVLTSFGGQTINTVEAWEKTRRPEIVKFSNHQVQSKDLSNCCRKTTLYWIDFVLEGMLKLLFRIKLEV